MRTAVPGKKVKIPSYHEKDCSSSLKVEQGIFSQVWLFGAALLAAAAASMSFEWVVSGVATAAALALSAFLGHLTLFSGFPLIGESEVDESTDAYLCLDGLDMDVSAGFSSLGENEVDESVDPGCLVSAAASGDPIFGLVTTTLCHEGGGSRSAFAQAEATPRVDVAETPEVEMELEKPECRFPVFVRTFFGTRTLYASSSMLISDFILLVSQSTAVPETSFYLTFQGTLLHGGHTIGEVGIGRDASLAMRGRLLGGATKGTSFPQYHEWYCVRCQRGGCWATKFSCFRCGLSRLESEAATGGFPQPTSKGGGKGKGVFREAQYPGRGGDGVPRKIPPTTRRVPNSGNAPAGSAVQIDQLIGLLTGLGCSAAVLGEVQEAVKAKAKPRVVPAAEHTVFVLKDKWDRAEAHRKFLQEHAERKQQEYEAASQRATDQAVVADDLKKAYWKARKELDKTAASCASASVGERESVNSDDGLANAGLDDEEMEQVYPECMLEHLEVPPAKRAKGRTSANNSSSDQPVGETAPVPPPVTQIQNLHLCQDEQQIMRAVQSWSPEALDTVVRLCTEHRNQEEALKGSLG